MAREVLVSYAAADRAAAESVCETLERDGVRVWMAPRDVRPGRSFAEEMIDAIGDARIVVLILSGRANESSQIEREIGLAYDRGVALLALRVEDVEPSPQLAFFLRRAAWVDAVSAAPEAAMARLAQEIERILASGSTRSGSPTPGRTASSGPPPKPSATSPRPLDAAADAASALDEATMARLAQRNVGIRRGVRPATSVPFEAGSAFDAPASAPSAPANWGRPASRGSRRLDLAVAALVVASAVGLAFRHELAGPAIWLAKLLRLGAAAPPPAAKPDADEVDVSAFAPPRARRGRSFLVQAFAHPSTAPAEGVAQLAREADPEAQRRGVATLDVEIAPGERLDFILDGEGVTIAEPQQSLVWRGRPRGCAFLVKAPAHFADAAAQLRLRVLRNASPIGAIRFAVAIDDDDRAARMEIVGEAAARYRRAFLSYASADRAEVLKRAQGLRAAGLDFFQDLLSLEPGERWERRLYAEIERCDLFLLFWSRAARDSEWVAREVAHAKSAAAAGGRPAEILPVLLEGPPPPSPPASLADLHFNDPLCYLIAAVEKMNAARPAS
jgi:hypothetical protein